MNRLFNEEIETGITGSATPALARQINIRRVLEIICTNPPLTRAEITKLSGISSPTMTKLFDELMLSGIINEVKVAPSGRGRPSNYYYLANEKIQIFGAIIGVKTCRIFTAEPSLKLTKIKNKEFATPDSYDKLLQEFRNFIEEELKADILFGGLALSVPGVLNTSTMEIVSCPNIHWLTGTSPAEDIVEGFGLHQIMLQEEHVLCLAECAAGNTYTHENFVILDISEGMGMGVFANGKYITGEFGFAGEIGHIPLGDLRNVCGCGRNGCLETSATDTALLKLAGVSTETSFDELKKFMVSGDINLNDELDIVIDYLAKGVAVIINIFNPGLILINGRMFSLSDKLLNTLRERAANYAMRPSATVCEIGLVSASREAGVVASIFDTMLNSIIR